MSAMAMSRICAIEFSETATRVLCNCADHEDATKEDSPERVTAVVMCEEVTAEKTALLSRRVRPLPLLVPPSLIVIPLPSKLQRSHSRDECHPLKSTLSRVRSTHQPFAPIEDVSAAPM